MIWAVDDQPDVLLMGKETGAIWVTAYQSWQNEIKARIQHHHLRGYLHSLMGRHSYAAGSFLKYSRNHRYLDERENTWLLPSSR